MPFTPRNELRNAKSYSFVKFCLSDEVVLSPWSWMGQAGYVSLCTVLNSNLWTKHTRLPCCFLYRKMAASNPRSPEGRVNANIVRMWQGRRAPPGTGRRREILLILRKHQRSSLLNCCLAWLLRVVSLLASTFCSVSAAGHGVTPVGPLLAVMCSASWGSNTNILRGS